MTKGVIRTGGRLAALALAVGGALALGACEEHTPAPAPTAAAPAPEESLAGAPSGYAPPSSRTPDYVPPPAQGEPGYGAPPPQGYAGDAPPPAGYPPGYGHRNAGGAPPEIVTMAPIPNPPEPPHGAARRPHHHLLHRSDRPAYRYSYAAPPHHRRHHHHRHAMMAAAPAVMHAHRPAAPHPAAHPALPAPAPQLTKPTAPPHHRAHRHATAPPAAAPAPSAAAASSGSANTAAAAGSEADRYQALQRALRDDFANAAQLQAPAHMDANQPADVTLTLPADFFQTVQGEAAKQSLTGALAQLNLTAALSGAGYAITPADPQTSALQQGQPTVFRWKVTPSGAGRGALTVAAKAQGAGDAHALDLGSKSTGAGSATGRVVGIGLLALVALVLLGWAAQRRRPAPTGAVKPRPAAYNQPPPVA